MIIRNKYLNISNEDVKKEEDLNTLHKWLIDIDENIASMDIIIAKEKINPEGDFKWLQRVITARRLQGVLKNTIQHRISIIKKNQRPISEYIIDTIRQNYSDSDWEIIVKKAMYLKQMDDGKV